MAKRITVTQEILDRIKNSSGDEVSADEIAVFEAAAVTTLPVRKKGTLYEGAIMSDGILKEMASYLQGEGNFVPLHTRHLQGYELPLGRVFFGEFVKDDNTGVGVLHTLFYLPVKEADLVDKVDKSVIEEVSVGVLPKHLLCSECGWDYLGADATPDHLWSRTCENGHTIGEDGVHCRVTGLDRFYELSLVSIGASQGAKILPKAKQLLAAEEYTRLAAAGLPPEAVVLYANHREEKTMTTKPENGDIGAFTAQVATLTNDLVDARASLKVSEASLTAANTQVADLTAKLADAEAKVTTDVAGLTAKLADAEGIVAKALAFLQDHAKKALVASGEQEPEAPETIEASIDVIEKAKVNLANLFPTGGVAQGAVTDVDKVNETSRLSAFKTTKQED